MRISNLRNIYLNKNVFFKRAPRDDVNVSWNNQPETVDYPNVIAEAKKYLGIQNLALILHQSSFPVRKNDLFIGSHINSKALELNEFLKFHGFDSIQLGPPGLTKLSPYTSSINSKNYLYTNFEKFFTKEYANLLTPADITNELDKIDRKRKYENLSDLTNFNKAFYVADKIYNRIYDNLLSKVHNGDEDAQLLNQEFIDYKDKHANWLEKDAIFVQIKNILGMDDDFFEWPHVHRNLFEYLSNSNSKHYDSASELYNELNTDYAKDLDLYKFKQFIIDKQENEFKSIKGKLTYTTDAIIGFHMMDYYANKDAFLKDYRVGTPYGGEGRSIGGGSPWGGNQTWDIPVLNPQKLFVKDKNGKIIGLGIAGKLLRQKFERLLDTFQNIRIDHAIGLIDPWIYNKNDVEIKTGRFSHEDSNTPEHVIYKNAYGGNISNFHKTNVYDYSVGWNKRIVDLVNEDLKNKPDIDPDSDYAKIIDEILIPLFKEKNVDPQNMAWETLGCSTPKFFEVYNMPRDGKVLPEITSAYQWQIQKRLSMPNRHNDTILLGSHDHPPFAQVCDDNFYKNHNCKNGIYEDLYIVGSLYPELTNDERSDIMHQLKWDRRKRVKLKIAEMLRFGTKIQLSFMDFFGLDKTYNYAGSQNQLNWKLRLNKSYQEDYYKKLSWKPGDSGVYNVALNMPELLKRCVISKFHSENKQNVDEFNLLVKKLDYYQKVLEE